MQSSGKASHLSADLIAVSDKAEKTPYLSASLHIGIGMVWGTAHPQNAFFVSEQSLLKYFKDRLLFVCLFAIVLALWTSWMYASSSFPYC